VSARGREKKGVGEKRRGRQRKALVTTYHLKPSRGA
jgi:hypothetical protein